MHSPNYQTLPPIETVWSALGGGPLKGNGDERRGQAFWRDGDGLNVAVNIADGTWFDHVAGEGGGLIDLAQAVMNCDRHHAWEWLRSEFGAVMPAGPSRENKDTAWAADLRCAAWWSLAAEAMAGETLEALPSWHPERLLYTWLLSILHQDDAVLVNDYRDWRRHEPTLTAAMVEAGRRHDARIQRRVAHWLKRELNENIT